MRPMFDSDGSVMRPADDSAVRLCQRTNGQSVELSLAGHSLVQHRAYFGYINWVHKNYGLERWPDGDAFRAQLSIECGHVKIIRVIVRGEWVDYHYPKSWSMRKSDQLIFQGLTERGSEWCETLGAPSFEYWLANKDKYLKA